MGEGDVDAGILWDWFVKSENFLQHKGTPAADMVKTVAYGMTSVHVIRWLAANGPGLPLEQFCLSKLDIHTCGRTLCGELGRSKATAPVDAMHQ